MIARWHKTKAAGKEVGDANRVYFVVQVDRVIGDQLLVHEVSHRYELVHDQCSKDAGQLSDDGTEADVGRGDHGVQEFHRVGILWLGLC